MPLRILAACTLACLTSIASAQMTGFCLPGVGGVTTCPCANPPTSTGPGCDNFGPTPPGGTGGALLSSTGAATASASTTFQFVITGEQGTVTVLFCGTTTIGAGVPFGAGLRCVGGNVIRSYKGQLTAGGIVFPNATTPTDAWTRSGMPASGTTRYYYAVYRNTAAVSPCGSSAANINATNGGAVTWT